MNAVLAIAQLAIRNAIRSRVVVVLLCLLLLVMVGIPLTVKGDGTVEGHIRILLNYTLGMAGFILAMATVWAGCAALSQEIEEKQIHLLATKPVWRAQIWLGKWLGLIALDAILLAAIGVTAFGMLGWTLRPGQFPKAEATRLASEIMTARFRIPPTLIDCEAAARRQVEERQARSDWPADVLPETLYKLVYQSLLTQAYTVPSGQSHQWQAPLPPGLSHVQPLQARFKFASSQLSPEPVPGTWIFRLAGSTNAYALSRSFQPGRVHTLPLPSWLAVPGGVLDVEYINTAGTEPVTLIFDPHSGLEILSRAGGFTLNLTRALLLMLFKLAMLAALGVTAGSLFSMPVAAFASLFALVLLGAGKLLQSVATQAVPAVTFGGQALPSFWNNALLLLYQGLYALIRPLQTGDPLEWVSDGILVSWPMVGTALAIQVLLYGGALALLGISVLNRRELATSE